VSVTKTYCRAECAAGHRYKSVKPGVSLADLDRALAPWMHEHERCVRRRFTWRKALVKSAIYVFWYFAIHMTYSQARSAAHGGSHLIGICLVMFIYGCWFGRRKGVIP
jgi:hypothetical protein